MSCIFKELSHLHLCRITLNIVKFLTLTVADLMLQLQFENFLSTKVGLQVPIQIFHFVEKTKGLYWK